MAKDKKNIMISAQEHEEFLAEFGAEKLATRNHNDADGPTISQLEKNALECVLKAGMFKQQGDQYVVDEKMHAMYFAIHHFMETGNHLDAFDLYCVYSGSFLNDEGDQLQNMMHFVASYETGAARLVQNHRDHYAHSAYVYILGLAIFNTQEAFRKAFRKSYGYTKSKCYSKFIELWGLTALFHDIGYQYEIPFNQIRENNKFDYFDDIVKKADDPAEIRNVYFQYQNMDKFTDLVNIFQANGLALKNKIYYPKEYLQDNYLPKLVGDTDDTFVPKDIEDVLAYHMQRKLASRHYLDREKIADKLRKKNTPTEKKSDKNKKKHEYDVFMDHAYYSGVLLFKQMVHIYGLKFCTNQNRLTEWMDAITAITMHNKFFEIELSEEKPMQMDEHPLAYLLILCDELQCWDRTSYGRSSVEKFFARDCEFVFEESGIVAKYRFDEKKDAIEFKDGKIHKVVAGPLEKFLINNKKQYIDTIEPKATDKPKATDDWDKKENWVENDCTTWHISSDDYPDGDDTKFLCSINKIVDCTGKAQKGIGVSVEASFKKAISKCRSEYLTTMSMKDVYDLAAKSYEHMHKGKKFDDSSRMIQDKLHDVMMIKAIGEILHEVKCFAVKDQKAFGRILQWDDSTGSTGFTEEEQAQMTQIMVKHQDSFLKENRIVLVVNYDVDYMNKHLEEFSRERVECIMKVLLEHPGMEVYRLYRDWPQKNIDEIK